MMSTHLKKYIQLAIVASVSEKERERAAKSNTAKRENMSERKYIRTYLHGRNDNERASQSVCVSMKNCS